MNFHLFFLLYDRTRHWRNVDLNRNTMPAKYRTFNHMHCRKIWRYISSPSDISELFHEDITTNISEKCSPLC
jgi:hypothetical protein